MKIYKIFDKMQSFTEGCKKAASAASAHLYDTKNRLMVKRLELLDKEQEFLRSQLSNQIPANTER